MRRAAAAQAKGRSRCQGEERERRALALFARNRSGGLPRHAISGAEQSPPARSRPVGEIGDGTETVISAEFRIGDADDPRQGLVIGMAGRLCRARKKSPLRDAGPCGIERELQAQFLIVPESYMTRVT